MIPPHFAVLDVKFQWCCATAEPSRLAPGSEGWHPPLLFLPVPERSATGRPTEWWSISTLGSHGYLRWNLWRSKMKHYGFSWVFIDVWQYLDSHRFSYVFPSVFHMFLLHVMTWKWFFCPAGPGLELVWATPHTASLAGVFRWCLDFSGLHFGFLLGGNLFGTTQQCYPLL